MEAQIAKESTEWANLLPEAVPQQPHKNILAHIFFDVDDVMNMDNNIFIIH